MKRAWLTAVLAALLALPGAAAGEEEELVRAKTIFNAGAQAYDAGDFKAAIRGFEEAYRLAGRPGILFSLAQAHRRQYFVDQQPEHLRAAIEAYHTYLDQVPKGGRRAEVARVLSELTPLAERLDLPAAPPAGTAPLPTPPRGATPQAPDPAAIATARTEERRTQLVISSQVREATAAIDGGAPKKLPFIGEVTPGKHKVTAGAPGYFTQEREIVAVEGQAVAIDIVLRDKPARLSVDTEPDATITIDGRQMGTTPLRKPLELPAGSYLVGVAKRGRTTFSREYDLLRGEHRVLKAPLTTTVQRYVSLTLLGTSAATFAAAGVLWGISAANVAKARGILDEAAEKGNIEGRRREEYERARTSSEELVRAGAVCFGAGLTLGLGGGTLLYIDFPMLTRDAGEGPTDTEAPRGDGSPLEISAAPTWTPGSFGVALTGRF